MALSTLNALRIVLTDWPSFIDAFPAAASNAGKLCAIALPLALLVAFAGLWRWRRWALWLLATATLATLVFDIAMRGPWLHIAAATMSTLLLAIALWLNRHRFVDSAVNSGGSGSQ